MFSYKPTDILCSCLIHIFPLIFPHLTCRLLIIEKPDSSLHLPLHRSGRSAHAKSSEKLAVGRLASWNGICMDYGNFSHSPFRRGQASRFCKKHITGFHIKIHLIGKAQDSHPLLCPKGFFQLILHLRIASAHDHQFFLFGCF